MIRDKLNSETVWYGGLAVLWPAVTIPIIVMYLIALNGVVVEHYAGEIPSLFIHYHSLALLVVIAGPQLYLFHKFARASGIEEWLDRKVGGKATAD